MAETDPQEAFNLQMRRSSIPEIKQNNKRKILSRWLGVRPVVVISFEVVFFSVSCGSFIAADSWGLRV